MALLDMACHERVIPYRLSMICINYCFSMWQVTSCFRSVANPPFLKVIFRGCKSAVFIPWELANQERLK